MKDNGIPLEFSSRAHELGRTHDVIGCLPVTLIVCRCEARAPLQLAGCPAQVSCPSCGRTFLLSAVTCDGHMVGTKIDTREKHALAGLVQ